MKTLIVLLALASTALAQKYYGTSDGVDFSLEWTSDWHAYLDVENLNTEPTPAVFTGTSNLPDYTWGYTIDGGTLTVQAGETVLDKDVWVYGPKEKFSITLNDVQVPLFLSKPESSYCPPPTSPAVPEPSIIFLCGIGLIPMLRRTR